MLWNKEEQKRQKKKKMQSKTAEFAPVPPPGELYEPYVLSLIILIVYSLCYMQTYDVIHKTRSRPT